MQQTLQHLRRSALYLNAYWHRQRRPTQEYVKSLHAISVSKGTCTMSCTGRAEATSVLAFCNLLLCFASWCSFIQNEKSLLRKKQLIPSRDIGIHPAYSPGWNLCDLHERSNRSRSSNKRWWNACFAEECLMAGRFPVSKAKSSYYCARRWETLPRYVKYTACSLSVLTGWHFNVLFLPPNPNLMGSFLDAGLQRALLSLEVYLLLLETELLLLTSSGSFGLPCLLVLFLPPFVSHAGLHAAGQSHIPHPFACRAWQPCFCSSSSLFLSATAAPNSLPRPSLSLPPPPGFLHHLLFVSWRVLLSHFPHYFPEHQLRGKEGIGKEILPHGLSGDPGVTRRIRAIHVIKKKKSSIVY